MRITYMHWERFLTNCASKIPVEHKVLFLLIHLVGGGISYVVGWAGEIHLFDLRRSRAASVRARKLSSLWIQLGTPFDKNADLRSAVNRVFALREFSKNNEVYGYISWPLCSLCLSDFDFISWCYFKRRVFWDTLGKLTQFQTKIF